ncbi:hypothetical protein F6O44_05630 [Klebsiella aerogenes]|nr:hypothetical protein [Klebsiella aerogenes]MBE0246794.1 hypothetical protein [Klebsiella aerogenes]QEU18763.1 hypothetical protein FOB49_08990 [Klebsiella aerogenes]QEV94709.1 hypothetical protein F6O44_05630 [Klebsiella aerogenes]
MVCPCLFAGAFFCPDTAAFCRLAATPYPATALPVPMASKPPVALPLTGATALCDLVARRRRNAPPPGKPLCDKKVANR